MAAPTVVVYGDFNCPWSLLASRRAMLLQRDGVQVDWRAVEHAPSRLGRDRAAARFAALRDEAERVLDRLLPGERLPYTLAGFATDTRAAIHAYAEAYRAGAASLARATLFEAFWNHAVDLADPHVVHTLLVDAIRTAPAAGRECRRWDYVLADARGRRARHQLVRRWAAEWQAFGDFTVPTLLLDDGRRIPGIPAVEWLGRELVARGVDLDPANGRGRSSPGPVGDDRPGPGVPVHPSDHCVGAGQH